MKDKPYYINLIIRFFDKRINDSQIEELKDWLNQSKENIRLFDEYNESYQYADILGKNSQFNPKKNWEELIERLRKESIDISHKIDNTKRLYWWRYTAIISIILVLSSTVWHINNLSKIKYESQSVKMIAPPGQKSQLILHDGTKVWLNSDSELDYYFDYNTQRRIVKLKGEAYFEVSKDTLRPFIVNTSEVIMKVYGTKFNVQAYEHMGTIKTLLEEGSVGMQIIATGKEMKIKPGQQITYLKQTKNMIVDQVNIDPIISWKQNILQFEDDSFDEVVNKLENWYGMTIKIDKSININGRYTMTIKNESIDEVLELIHLITPINYEIINETVFIHKEK